MYTNLILIVILKENLTPIGFLSHFGIYRELKSECWESRHLLCEKILNYF